MRPRPGYIVFALCLSAFLVALIFRSHATANGVPLLTQDAVVFLPQTVPYRVSGDLVNTAWPPARALDPTGEGRMTYHGFLYPIVISWLMTRDDYMAVAESVGILQALGAMMYFVVLLSLMRRWRWAFTPGRVLLALFITVAAAHYLQGVVARPEVLAALLLNSTILGLSCTPANWHGRIAGVGLGLVTAADPIMGVFGGIGFAGYAAWRFTWRDCLREVIGTAGLALIVFAACVAWYPYTFGEWLYGTLRMGTHALTNPVEPRSAPLFLETIQLPEVIKAGFAAVYRNVPFLTGALGFSAGWFLVGMFPLGIWTGFKMVRRYRGTTGGPRTPWMFYGAVVLGAWGIHEFVLYTAWATYNMLPLMPLGMLAVFHELGRDRPRPRPDVPAHRMWPGYRGVAVTCLAIASLGFGMDLFQRACGLRFGSTLAEARAQFQAVRRDFPGEIIAMPFNMLTVVDDFSQLAFWSKEIPAGATLMIDAQMHRRTEHPAEFEGFRLVRNHFQPERPQFAGILLTKVYRGCGFAVYSRITGDPRGGAATAPPPRSASAAEPAAITRG